MKDTLTVKEIRTFELAACRQGFSETLFIENASSNLACAVDALGLGRKALIVAGCGNNGADVLACARKLAARNYKVRIFLVHEKEPNANSAFQVKLLKALRISMRRLGKNNRNDFLAAARDSDFIIDGILGIGVHGNLSEFLSDTINIINGSGRPIVACDIPSGLEADSGKVLGVAIRAAYTITFTAAKRAFSMPGQRLRCGKIITVDIGISRAHLKALSNVRYPRHIDHDITSSIRESRGGSR